jgi:hypothetical protein
MELVRELIAMRRIEVTALRNAERITITLSDREPDPPEAREMIYSRKDKDIWE